MNVSLHIERLVLEGLDIAPGQRHLLQSAVEIELGRLLTEGGVASEIAAGGALSTLAGNSMQLHHGNGPAELGRKIAGAVYGGIGK